MDKKAQAGLEFLLSYVWALVLIATLVGLIFFIIVEQEPEIKCISNDPTRLVLQSYSMPYSRNAVSAVPACGNAVECLAWGMPDNGDAPGKMVLHNITGGRISITSVIPTTESSSFEECEYYNMFVPYKVSNRLYVAATEESPLTVMEGRTIEISPVYNVFYTATQGCSLSDADMPSGSSFTIRYSDQFDVRREVIIACTGFMPPQIGPV